jgi:predicted ATPase/transcriptional regulator with XRE-family HTH domain
MDDIISFGRWLKLRRIALYLTQDDLGRLAGCSAITIRKIEADERRPSPELAEKLAQHLDLDSEYRRLFLRSARAELSPLRLPAPTAAGMAGGYPGSLPLPPTPLVGRESEVTLVRERLLRHDVRLLTLTGPGGVGKTRVALEVAAELTPAFVAGIQFVALAPVGEPTLVVPTVAQALGVKEAGARPLLDRLKAYLSARALLLVLDNFEHLASAAPLVTELLASAPRLKVLATSRVPLHLSGEYEIAVPPLPEQEAVRLFVIRSQAVRADFALASEDAPAATEICRRLDGLPLAIELAAARSRLFTPQSLLAQLGEAGVATRSTLWLLTSGPTDLLPRQQTLRNTIEWSYNLLGEEERWALTHLGVFAGGFTVEAASAVISHEKRVLREEELMLTTHEANLTTLDLLASLLDKSLLRRDVGPGGELRFRMLETVRVYALERLATSGEVDNARLRHAIFYLHEAEAAARQIHSDQQRVWVERLTADYHNMRAALEWSLAATPAEIGLRLAWSLAAYWFWRGHFSEGRMWLDRTLERRAGSSELAQARVLLAAGLLATHQMEQVRIVALLEEALALFRTLEDRAGCAESLLYLGLVALERGGFAQGEALVDEGLRLCQEPGSPLSGLALLFLGRARFAQGDQATAERLLEQSLALFRSIGDPWLAGHALISLGPVALSHGDDRRAEALIEQGMALQGEVGTPWGTAEALIELGRVAQRRGDSRRALDLYRESLAMLWDIGGKSKYVACLEGIGSLAVAQRRPEHAARLFAVAAALRESFSTPLAPVEREEHERALTSARAQLGETAFAAAWSAGRALTLEAAIAEALALC